MADPDNPKKIRIKNFLYESFEEAEQIVSQQRTLGQPPRQTESIKMKTITIVICIIILASAYMEFYFGKAYVPDRKILARTHRYLCKKG